MSNICRILDKEERINLTLIHCYRGWSDIEILKKQNYKIILVSPETYYHGTEKNYKTIKKKARYCSNAGCGIDFVPRR